jgi:hypothetical protein
MSLSPVGFQVPEHAAVIADPLRYKQGAAPCASVRLLVSLMKTRALSLSSPLSISLSGKEQQREESDGEAFAWVSVCVFVCVRAHVRMCTS